MADLVFAQAPLGLPADLVFGEVEDLLANKGGVALVLGLPVPAVTGDDIEPDFNDGALTFTLGLPAPVAYGDFNLATERPVVGAAQATHRNGLGTLAGVQPKSRAGERLRPGVTVEHQIAVPTPAGVAALQQEGQRTASATAAVHAEAVGLRASASHAHAVMLRGARPTARLRHADAIGLRASARSAHQERWRDRRPALSLRHAEAVGLRTSLTAQSGAGAPASLRRRTRHQEAMRPPAGVAAAIVLPPGKPPCYLPDTNLVFSEAAAVDGNLVFFCELHDNGGGPVATLIIPIRSLYMLTNNLTLTRVSDGALVPAISARIACDAESWTWGFSAELPGSALALVDGAADEPVELLLSVNGLSFRVMAEGLRRNRSFERSTLTITGRGRSAALGAPFAAERNFSSPTSRTAQQLAQEALLVNGVPSGWDLDWRLADWLVPGGAWARSGTPIDAIQAIAAVAGGYVQPHPTDRTLIILPRYPELPRDWPSMTPDLQLPSSVVSVEGIDWANRPSYNRVFLAGGEVGGLLGDVRIDGSAGDLVAPMLQDPLLTDVAAIRQRARAILGDTNRQARVSLRVPSLPELGLVGPGKLVRYADGATSRLGLVRSFELEANEAQAWQTIGLETHV